MINLYKAGLYKCIRGRCTGKAKKATLIDMYMNLITLIAAAEFDYKTPDFNKYQYETAINTGVAAFYKCNVKGSVNYGKWCCTPAFPAAVPDNLGITKKITTAGSDYALTLEVDTDCILIYNNSALYPDYIFCSYAEQLAECDISSDKLVKWSRMNPIPKVSTNEDIAKYSTAMQRIIDGDDITVITDELAALSDGHKTIDDNVLRLTDEKSIDKMHFLDEHHEQLVRRLATIGGLPFSTTAKSAQNLTDELHDMDALSTFIINDRYNCRKEGFERAAAFMAALNEPFDFEFKKAEVLEKQTAAAAVSFEKEQAELEKLQAETEEIKEGENNEGSEREETATGEDS